LRTDIKVGIAGVGAIVPVALVQGVEYYRIAKAKTGGLEGRSMRPLDRRLML